MASFLLRAGLGLRFWVFWLSWSIWVSFPINFLLQLARDFINCYYPIHLFPIQAISVTCIPDNRFFYRTFTGLSRDIHGALLYYNPIVNILESYMILSKIYRTCIAVNNFKSLVNRFEKFSCWVNNERGCRQIFQSCLLRQPLFLLSLLNRITSWSTSTAPTFILG